MVHDPMDLAQKAEILNKNLCDYGTILVAFSGGLDSSVLAYAAHQALGKKAIAVTAFSASTPTGQLETAREVADHIGIQHLLVETEELDDPAYRENTPERCYLCKKIILGTFKKIAHQENLSVTADGTNADDANDYRPGAQAVKELGIQTPLLNVGLTKPELRKLAKQWGLPNHDLPASPCLSTRIAYGLPITKERLLMIDRAEQYVRAVVGPKISIRIRCTPEDTARIEVPKEHLATLLEDPTARQKLVDHLRKLGFQYVTLNLEAFQSGSLNRVLNEQQDTCLKNFSHHPASPPKVDGDG